MAHAEIERHPSSFWSDRLFEVLPVAPIWVGAGIAALLIGLFFVSVVATGEFSRFMASETRWWQDRDGRMGLLIALLLAYLPTARRYATTGTRRNLVHLAAAAGWSRRQLEAARREIEALDPRAMRRWGAIALLLVPLIALGIDRDPTLYLQSWYWKRAAPWWSWGLGFMVCWNAALLFYTIQVYARRFSSLGSRLPEIDLLDLSGLAPFARQGLRSALPWVILLSFWAVNLIDSGWLLVIGVMGPLTLASGSAALLLPMRGVHGRIRETKRAELTRVNAAIRGDASALEASAIASRAKSVGLADLLAYREFIGSVQEWPFDAPTRLRFLLYLAIPLGSWLGGAFVERLLESALA